MKNNILAHAHSVRGRSLAITCQVIAVRKLDSGQTLSFSIHQVAEQGGVPFGEIEGHYHALERQMLDAFYAHVGGYKGLKYLHWNMRARPGAQSTKPRSGLSMLYFAISPSS
jgi:hypothetical protein